MKTIVLLIYICIVFNSCATIFNQRMDRINIITTEPAQIKIRDQLLNNYHIERLARVRRSKDTIKISAITDNKSKTVSIPSKLSFAFFSNIFSPYLLPGFLIDFTNKKRFSYPKTIYIDLNHAGNDYLTYIPLDSIYIKENLVKLTPLKMTSLVNSGFSVSYEKVFSKRLSTQITATYLFPENGWGFNKEFKQHIKGFHFAVEERIYLNASAPLGPYASLEFDYLKNKYYDFGEFGYSPRNRKYRDDLTNYSDTFGIKKQTYSFNLKFGYQYIIRRFAIDMYIGVGPRLKNVRHFDTLKPDYNLLSSFPIIDIKYQTNRKGKYWTISIPMNVRIAWTF